MIWAQEKMGFCELQLNSSNSFSNLTQGGVWAQKICLQGLATCVHYSQTSMF